MDTPALRIEPVACYKQPAYPTRDVLRHNPGLLKLLPKRWQKSAAVLVAVGIVAGLLYASRKVHQNSHVAPVFEHGDGVYQATFGCIAVTPPIFLSEDEARYAIAEEAKKAGISLLPTNHSITLRVPATNPYHSALYTGGGAKRLALDGGDPSRHLYYEYISIDDYTEWEVNPVISSRMIYGSAYPYAYRLSASAQALQQALSKTTEPGYVATFYDPILNKTEVPGECAHARLKSGVVVVPLLPLAEGLGLKVEERWERPNYKVAAGKMMMHINRDSYRFSVNGREHEFEYWSTGYSRSGPNIPLHQFCTIIGARQTWDRDNHTVTVTYPPTGKTLTFSVDGPLASKEALRAQVRDFITWLKAQGAI
jgi:hypothetical protein